MDEQKTALKGREAATLLENPVLQEIWEGIEKEAVDALAQCSMKPDSKDDRDALIWHLKMVRKQKSMFYGMVEQGKFAQHKIDMQREESVSRRFFRKVVNG